MKFAYVSRALALGCLLPACSVDLTESAGAAHEAASSCTNVAPDTRYTCDQQASWGKCGEPWMQGKCDASCGRCAPDTGSGGTGSGGTSSGGTGGTAGGSCTDVPPAGAYTCAQQAGWGKCNEPWMQGKCDASCGRCSSGGTGGATGTGGAGGIGGTGGSAGTGGATGLEILREARVIDRLATLSDQTLEWWLTHGVDSTYGGFHATLDENGVPVAPTDKGLVQQARHLYAFSTWYRLRWSKRDRVKSAADATYRFLRTKMLDTTDGEFRFKVTRSGDRVVDSKKQLYAEAFAMFGLSAYARAFNDTEAANLALGCFRSVDSRIPGRRHDAVYGGYEETADPGWLSGGVEKGVNTQLHMMEALTELYRATGDTTVRDRANDMVDTFAEDMVKPLNDGTAYLCDVFKRDWTCLNTGYLVYGHDLEAAWLMLDSATALGRPNDATVRSAASRLGRHTSARGFDSVAGGLFDSGRPLGEPTNRDKIWWAQFEALPGLFRTYELTREDAHLRTLVKTLEWLERSPARDTRPGRGEWYWGVRDGRAVREAGQSYTVKGEEWKATYHNVRALLLLEDWLTQALH